MSEIERLLDEDTPEEFEYLFSHSEDKDIVQTVIDIWSTLN
jgi:hypothetical protein